MKFYKASALSLFLKALQRAFIPLIALAIALLLLTVRMDNTLRLVGFTVFLPVVMLGLFDVLQKKSALLCNYPVAARLRWFFYDLRPFFRAYIVEDDQEGKPYSLEARELVYARAQGNMSAHPFGTELDTDSYEYQWITHSVSPEPNPDSSPRVLVGGPQCSRPYSASIFNISAMSFGALSGAAVKALNKGARLGRFYQDTGEGGISPHHLAYGGDLVWELGSGYFGCRDEKGRFDPALFAENASHEAVKMIEIKLSQGAKPGHGGLLPKTKISEEIARTRKISMGQDCISPRSHAMFSTPLEMLEFAAQLRELAQGKAVGIKLCVGHIHEVMAIVKAMLEAEIYLDYIVVDGAEGGTGAAPLELSNHVGMPLQEGLLVMRNALVGTGLNKVVKLAAGGKVFSAVGLAKNLAIGADWCNAARAFMFSIGCIQSQRCHEGTCPTGITTQDGYRQRGLIAEVAGARAARYHRETLAALADIVAAAGFKHPKDLQPHHLYHRLSATEAYPVDQIWCFLSENALLDDPDRTPYGQYWRAATPASFSPVGDLTNSAAVTPRSP
ncbi:FMN-binding glutamate synthase family protein [Methylomarinum vadi]|uniref:FMN-binding glutamate synthase family protein n=1 Tax=Methylomarinum vadi TaxID=438855 RepID=UPI0006903E1A|nr:FMN-binding glutamate synthase family protein [Methylomarinum vadi]